MTLTQSSATAAIIPAQDKHTHTVFWLHGLGADGHDFTPLIAQLSDTARAGVRFILPHAPVQPVTINGGLEMRAWYDIRTPNLTVAVDDDGITRSVTWLNEHIAAEIALGIPSHRILLAGFSQGGVIALQTGLTAAEPLAGILALSTYLPTWPHVQEHLTEANRQTPILQMHGRDDDIVPWHVAHNVHQQLDRLGYPSQWHDYAMAHSLCAEQIPVISTFIEHCLGGRDD
ncbi:MAG: dienelactone hydrolase family protein [Methylococcales bacterium]|nr:dienelactone hydrolase family protein [Methylococcales bacterium]